MKAVEHSVRVYTVYSLSMKQNKIYDIFYVQFLIMQMMQMYNLLFFFIACNTFPSEQFIYAMSVVVRKKLNISTYIIHARRRNRTYALGL